MAAPARKPSSFPQHFPGYRDALRPRADFPGQVPNNTVLANVSGQEAEVVPVPIATIGSIIGGGGGGVQGSGTAGYVPVWTDGTTLNDSSIRDTGTASTGIILTLGTLTTPDDITGTDNGINLTLNTGIGGGTSGAGGTLRLSTGTASVTGYGGGDIQFRPGAGGYGGSITGIAGDGSDAGAPGGGVQFIGGTAIGVSAGTAGSIQLSGGSSQQGAGGPVLIQGGLGATTTGTGAGGPVQINGGDGGVSGTAGDGGNVTILGGPAGGTVGVGGTIGITGGNGIPGGRVALVTGSAQSSSGSNGGNVDVVLGAGDGAGHRGRLNITGLPTSSAGLASGDVWLDTNVLTIIP